MSTHEALVTELAAGIRIRRAPRFDERTFPMLQHLASSSGCDDVRAFITAGIDAIPDDAYREAASELVGFGPNRWTPLRTRRSAAASVFFVGVDAFRRLGTGHEHDVIAVLASSLQRISESSEREVDEVHLLRRDAS